MSDIESKNSFSRSNSVDGVRLADPLHHVQEARQEAALGGGRRGGPHADEDLSALQLHH